MHWHMLYWCTSAELYESPAPFLVVVESRPGLVGLLRLLNNLDISIPPLDLLVTETVAKIWFRFGSDFFGSGVYSSFVKLVVGSSNLYPPLTSLSSASSVPPSVLLHLHSQLVVPAEHLGPSPSLAYISDTLGQKRRREREAQENVKPVASASSSSRRSLAQQARRQRELAAAMERELTGAESSDANVRSNAQKFRRQVEAAERRLDIAPNCDSSEALARILDFNVDNFGSIYRVYPQAQRMYMTHWVQLLWVHGCAMGRLIFPWGAEYGQAVLQAQKVGHDMTRGIHGHFKGLDSVSTATTVAVFSVGEQDTGDMRNQPQAQSVAEHGFMLVRATFSRTPNANAAFTRVHVRFGVRTRSNLGEIRPSRGLKARQERHMIDSGSERLPNTVPRVKRREGISGRPTRTPIISAGGSTPAGIMITLTHHNVAQQTFFSFRPPPSPFSSIGIPGTPNFRVNAYFPTGCLVSGRPTRTPIISAGGSTPAGIMITLTHHNVAQQTFFSFRPPPSPFSSIGIPGTPNFRVNAYFPTGCLVSGRPTRTPIISAGGSTPAGIMITLTHHNVAQQTFFSFRPPPSPFSSIGIPGTPNFRVNAYFPTGCLVSGRPTRTPIISAGGSTPAGIMITVTHHNVTQQTFFSFRPPPSPCAAPSLATMDRKSIVLATLLQSTEADIDDYKAWIGASRYLSPESHVSWTGLPPGNAVFNASNVLDWIKLGKFNDDLTFLAVVRCMAITFSGYKTMKIDLSLSTDDFCALPNSIATTGIYDDFLRSWEVHSRSTPAIQVCDAPTDSIRLSPWDLIFLFIWYNLQHQNTPPESRVKQHVNWLLTHYLRRHRTTATFLARRSEIAASNAQPPSGPDVIDISDDEEPSQSSEPAREIIELSDSDSDGEISATFLYTGERGQC
ncbi:hypothetical protein C8R46DRAFT_1196183 [Mycena filopes]|nr:hypothetical protein C8R46DRAFT_1196183 [Mycena filopes]